MSRTAAFILFLLPGLHPPAPPPPAPPTLTNEKCNSTTAILAQFFYGKNIIWLVFSLKLKLSIFYAYEGKH